MTDVPDRDRKDANAGPEHAQQDAFFPGRAAIDAYGNGGFRFAEMSHRGGLLCLPSGIYGWTPPAPDTISADDFARVVAESDAVEVLLFGTGATQVFPPPAVREALSAHGIGLEPMTTGSAARTYNILLAEQRAVAAALIPVP